MGELCSFDLGLSCNGRAVDNHQSKRHFTYLTVLVLSLVAINATGWGIYAEKTARYYDLINVSGKQRMLTQRIAYFANQDTLDQKDLTHLEKALALIKKNHLRFAHGAEEFNLDKPQEGDKFYELYFGPARLDKAIHQLIQSVQTYVDTKGAQRPYKQTSTIPNQLLSKTNLAVELYLAQAKEKTQQIVNWLVMLNFIFLIAILIQISWIYKAMFRTDTDATADVIAADDSPRTAPASSHSHSQLDDNQEHQTHNLDIAAIPTPESATTQRHHTNTNNSAAVKTSVKSEYQTDLPHPLECKRFMFLNCDQSKVDELCSELAQIVGTQTTFVSNLNEALNALHKAEDQHTPFDIIITTEPSDFEACKQQLAQETLKQDYCCVLLANDSADAKNGYIPMDSKVVANITEAYLPYESLSEQKQHPVFEDKHVLIVDDNEINLMVLEGMVQKSKPQCALARDGQQALELAQKQKFDLIFMDLQMPIMNGYESSEKILFETPNNTTPIVAVTANHNYSDRKRCVEIGMIDCEAKPVHHNTVEKILYKYMR